MAQQKFVAKRSRKKHTLTASEVDQLRSGVSEGGVYYGKPLVNIARDAAFNINQFDLRKAIEGRMEYEHVIGSKVPPVQLVPLQPLAIPKGSSLALGSVAKSFKKEDNSLAKKFMTHEEAVDLIVDFYTTRPVQTFTELARKHGCANSTASDIINNVGKWKYLRGYPVESLLQQYADRHQIKIPTPVPQSEIAKAIAARGGTIPEVHEIVPPTAPTRSDTRESLPLSTEKWTWGVYGTQHYQHLWNISSSEHIIRTPPLCTTPSAQEIEAGNFRRDQSKARCTQCAAFLQKILARTNGTNNAGTAPQLIVPTATQNQQNGVSDSSSAEAEKAEETQAAVQQQEGRIEILGELTPPLEAVTKKEPYKEPEVTGDSKNSLVQTLVDTALAMSNGDLRKYNLYTQEQAIALVEAITSERENDRLEYQQKTQQVMADVETALVIALEEVRNLQKE